MTYPDLYTYRAELATPPHGGEGAYDGDTWWLWVDTGFDQWFRSKFRMASFDTPEVSGTVASEYEKEKGRDAQGFATEWMAEPFLIHTYRASEAHDVDEAGKYGRWLADPFRVNEAGHTEQMGDYLMGLDLATEWPTRWRTVYDRFDRGGS